MPFSSPVVLDIDGSCGYLPGEQRLQLRNWQERLRYSCRKSDLDALQAQVGEGLLRQSGPFFLGSGDFHHLSLPIIAAHARTRLLDVVVLDNHPDNMRFPFAIHCGSWVRQVAALPGVRRVHVVGIHSQDIAWPHFWENNWWPLYSGRVHYWSVQVDVRYVRCLGLSQMFHGFNEIDALLDALKAQLEPDFPLYLSIDKDVLAAEAVRTNWDQGMMQLPQMYAFVAACRTRLTGCDVTGDISFYQYQQLLKRLLSRLDGQETQEVPPALKDWQLQQHQVNLQLCRLLASTVPEARLD